jgi:hypothetical protein
MKTALLVTALTLVAVAATALPAEGAGSGMSSSPHNFSHELWYTTGKVCRVCHVYHNHTLASKYKEQGLPWNREVKDPTYVTIFTTYWSLVLDENPSPKPDGLAKLCLSCHDGIIAGEMPFFNNLPGFGHSISYPFVIHPVSVEYNMIKDEGLNNPDSTKMGLSGKISDVLDFGLVQCSSCHDVHGEESIPDTHLLRAPLDPDDESPGLCFTCHKK